MYNTFISLLVIFSQLRHGDIHIKTSGTSGFDDDDDDDRVVGDVLSSSCCTGKVTTSYLSTTTTLSNPQVHHTPNMYKYKYKYMRTNTGTITTTLSNQQVYTHRTVQPYKKVC